MYGSDGVHQGEQGTRRSVRSGRLGTRTPVSEVKVQVEGKEAGNEWVANYFCRGVLRSWSPLCHACLRTDVIGVRLPGDASSATLLSTTIAIVRSPSLLLSRTARTGFHGRSYRRR